MFHDPSRWVSLPTAPKGTAPRSRGNGEQAKTRGGERVSWPHTIPPAVDLETNRPGRYDRRSMASRIGVLGWVTGVLSAVLGALAFGAVLCLWFPAVLTTPALRDVYPMEIVRTTIKVTLGVAFVLGAAQHLPEAAEGAGPHRGGARAAGHAHGRLRGGGGHAGRAREPRGPRLVPARSLPALRHLRADRAALRPAAPAADLPARVADGPLALRGEPSARAAHRVPDHGARGDLLPLGGGAGAPGRGGRAAAGAAVRRGPAGRRFDPVHGAPSLPPGALALALPRDPPLEPADGLAGRLASAPGGHRGDARAVVRAALRARLRPGRGLRVRALRVVPGGADPRQRELALRAGPPPPGDAAVPPLASRGRAGGRQLRGAPAGDRPDLRHAVPAARPLARGLRPRGRARCPPTTGASSRIRSGARADRRPARSGPRGTSRARSGRRAAPSPPAGSRCRPAWRRCRPGRRRARARSAPPRSPGPPASGSC